MNAPDPNSDPELDPEPERRRSSRYAPARAEVWVGWEGPSGFQSARVQIVNISFGGIALLDDIPLPEGTPLWIRLIEAAERIPWASVAVAGHAEHESGATVLRLRFLDDCPYDFYRAAVFGFAEQKDFLPPAPMPIPTPAAKGPGRPEEAGAPPLPAQAHGAVEFHRASRPIGITPGPEGLREAFTRQRRFDRGTPRPFTPSGHGYGCERDHDHDQDHE